MVRRRQSASAASGLRFVWRVMRLAFVLMLAAPGATDVLEDVISAAVGADCCDDCVSHGSADGTCPGSCPHCACCAQPSALPAVAMLVPACEPRGTTKYGFHRVLPCPSGYRAPPFRPPTA